MDEIETRLRETSDVCVKSYISWRDNKKNGVAREALQDAVHELRKVASRLEIELAISERNEMAQKPIPIPPHRAAQKRPGQAHSSHAEDTDDGEGNNGNAGNNGAPRVEQRRRSQLARRSEQQGGGQQGNQ